MKSVEKFAIPHENEEPVVSVEIGKTIITIREVTCLKLR